MEGAVIRSDPTPPTTVVAAEDRDPATLILIRQLERSGLRAELAENFEALRRSCACDGPRVLLLDMRLPYAGQAGRWLKASPRRARTVLVTVRGGSEAASGFVIHGDAALVEPYEHEDLLNALRAPGGGDVHKLRFSFGGRHRGEVLQYAEELLRENRIPPSSAAEMLTGFLEAVDNAVRHGNKARDGARVEVVFLRAPGRVEFVVADEGDGFDAQLALTERVRLAAADAARTTYIQGRRGGLGLIMMHRSLDEVLFEDGGNRVRLIKYV